ncbi:DUF2145 domain-containing protein [Acidovorax sp. SUPP3434]|nr:DUF2145 domain-containing protein [Acidovorax sp. SUPP3434]
MTAAQQDRLLRFSSVVRDELAATQGNAVLISRSGLDLSRFKIRYSHAAVALRGENGAWSVRQLYYACDEGRPRLYDQGMAGFVMGTEDPALGYISIVTLPKEAADDLHRAALDRPRALRLLASHYSANAYAFGLAYQNCNQWVIEMLAAAWGDLPDGQDLRARAQHWLMSSGYSPVPVDIGSSWLMVASVFVPLVHLNDHPEADRAARKLRISLPTTVEKFVQDRYPDSERVEICHDGTQAVVHRGWESVQEGCRPAEEDRIVPLNT